MDVEISNSKMKWNDSTEAFLKKIDTLKDRLQNRKMNGQKSTVTRSKQLTNFREKAICLAQKTLDYTSNLRLQKRGHPILAVLELVERHKVQS